MTDGKLNKDFSVTRWHVPKPQKREHEPTENCTFGNKCQAGSRGLLETRGWIKVDMVEPIS
jgi:hypothetical protein